MRRLTTLLSVAIALPALGQTIRPGDNLVLENVPAIPTAVADKADRYGEFRAAGIQDWHPKRREMLIGTRFGDVPQVHVVKMPGGARSQLTFFPDRVGGAHYGPRGGEYFTFSKDVGGGEWYQFFRYDLADGSVT